MKIKKRDNTLEQLSFDKIIYRLRKLSNDQSIGVLKTIDPDLIAQRVVSSIYDGITSQELDEEAARIAIGMTDNPEYAKLASRIVISNLHKSTIECFSEVMELLYANKDKSGNHAPIIADDIIEIVRKNKNELNFAINYTRDYMFDYFGFKTLEKSYLMKIWGNNKMIVVERPQHMYMRVALGIHKDDIKFALETYELISQHFYTHASPTLFNSGTKLSNLSSCFHEDTIVTTVNRGPIKIKDVVIGDSVVTHKGNVRKVVQLHKNLLGERKLYELNIAKTAPIKVTDNHKLWVLRGKPDTKTYGTRPYAKYDIEFVRDYLQKDNCELISTEYTNMKTKLQFKCICGTICNASFECIYYNGVRCSSRKCIYERKKSKDKKVTSLDAQWISVEDLRPGDYIGIPNKQEEVERIKVFDLTKFDLKSDRIDVEYQMNFDDTRVRLRSQWTQPGKFKESHRDHNSINRFWKIDENFAKFIGIFYGDGHIVRGKTSYGDIVNRGIGITIHNVNHQLVNFCKDYGEKLFGITPTFHAVQNQNITQVLFNSVYIGEIFKALFGVGFNNKKVWSEMYKWEAPLIKALLEGLVTTDGCVTSSCVSIQMSNVNFMRQLYYLLRNNNIDASYGKPHLQRNWTQEHVMINIPVECVDKTAIYKTYTDDRMSDRESYCRNQYSYRSTDKGFKFLKYNSKTEITQDLPQYVYTLGVEEDHSYNVEGIVAENCFLIGTNDSIEGIYKTITDCGRISKVGGGIGVHVSNIRAKGSLIRGTNGISDGIVPMLKVYNSTSVYINQSGRRKGSFAMYLEPWHADIMEFLDMKKNQGHEDMRARDLFYALWTPDLFMKQVEADGDWYLMCPDECPGLPDVYGKDFEDLYNKYVEEKKYKKVVKAQEVWRKVLDSQIETGVPYISYKDAVNKKCNQKNLGTIRSSNLCNEISLYSDDKEYGTCNLASVALPKYVEYTADGIPYFNFEKLREVAEYVIKPMNKVIDNNYYPTEETKKSNFSHRPLGIGVQGLADVYIKMRYPFESKEAKDLNKKIFETLYYGCMKGSIEIAKKEGPYSTFKGSPFSEGKFQFDLAAEFDGIKVEDYLSGMWDWEGLREELKTYGARNSMLVALMPTASTAQIMGNSECFEAIDSCIFKRRVLSGEYLVINKHLVGDLLKLNLWSKEMKDKIIAHNGSIQNIDEIPDDLKAIYKTVWETSMKSVIEQASDRGVFVDQMQSMNLFMANPTYKKLTSMHFHAWKHHLKSGMYYLRSKASASAGKFSVDVNLEKQVREKQQAGKRLTKKEEALLCSIDNKDECMMCSS
uniref:ribonucleoside-diphosphate reductase n=1 Tax=viral metagenome TaxID=1070528 RepID=A0A6C0E0N6_9ZZZZ